MKKYKFKIKLRYLVLAIFTVLLLIPGAFCIVGSTMIKMEGEFLGKNKRYYGAASLEIYSKIPKVMPNSGKIYYDIAKGYYDVISDVGVYSNYYKTTEKFGNENRLNKSIESYKNGLDLGEDDNYYVENLSMLINTLVASGNKEEAIKYIEKAKVGKSDRVRKAGIINEIILMVKDGKIEEAINLCKKNIDDKEFDILYINILYSYGSFNEFNEELTKRINRIKEVNDELNEQSYNPYMNYENDKIYNIFLYKDVEILKYVDFKCSTTFEKRDNGSGIIEGEIINDNNGASYQRVTIGKGVNMNLQRQGNVVNGLMYRTVYTNSEGKYKVEEISNGEYSYELFIQGYLLDNSYINIKNISKEDEHKEISINSEIFKMDFSINKYISIKNKDSLIKESNDWLIINIPKVDGAKGVRVEFSNFALYSFESSLDEDGVVKIPLDNKSFIMKRFDNNEKYDSYGNEYIGTV